MRAAFEMIMTEFFAHEKALRNVCSPLHSAEQPPSPSKSTVSIKAMSARPEGSSRLASWKLQTKSGKSVTTLKKWPRQTALLKPLCAFQGLALPNLGTKRDSLQI